MCKAASRPAGSAALGVVGHGTVDRLALGPVEPGGLPQHMVLTLRRYRCRACRAVLTVGPHGLEGGRWYGAGAIAAALAHYGGGMPSAAVRTLTSHAKHRGASAADEWITVKRWAAAVVKGRLLGLRAVAAPSARDAARVAALALAGRGGHEPGEALAASAFRGATVAA